MHCFYCVFFLQLNICKNFANHLLLYFWTNGFRIITVNAVTFQSSETRRETTQQLTLAQNRMMTLEPCNNFLLILHIALQMWLTHFHILLACMEIAWWTPALWCIMWIHVKQTYSVNPRPQVRPPQLLSARFGICSIAKSIQTPAQALSDLRTDWNELIANCSFNQGCVSGNSLIIWR